jgi:hypothetical protein
MMIIWESFTPRAEIGVITDGALEAGSVDVTLGGRVLAEGSVTENAVVDLMFTRSLTNSVVNLNEPMAWVALRRSQNAIWAIIPVRASQALVANTNDTLDDVSRVFFAGLIGTYLITAVANSGVAELPSRKATRCDQILQAEVTVRAEVECVTRVVAMSIPKKASQAEVVIFALLATYEVALIGFTTASIADGLVLALNGCIQASR